jgi:hypothetical protein
MLILPNSIHRKIILNHGPREKKYTDTWNIMAEQYARRRRRRTGGIQ